MGSVSLNTSESGMSVSISMPLDALIMMALSVRKGANCFATARTVWEGTTERITVLPLTAVSSTGVTSTEAGREKPGK